MYIGIIELLDEVEYYRYSNVIAINKSLSKERILEIISDTLSEWL